MNLLKGHVTTCQYTIPFWVNLTISEIPAEQNK